MRGFGEVEPKEWTSRDSFAWCFVSWYLREFLQGGP